MPAMQIFFCRTDVLASHHVNARQMPPHKQSRAVRKHQWRRIEISIAKCAVEPPVTATSGKAPGLSHTHRNKPNEIPTGPIRRWCLWRVPVEAQVN